MRSGNDEGETGCPVELTPLLARYGEPEKRECDT